jgi:glycosyltransferase involved in cell wall biosynthesis
LDFFAGPAILGSYRILAGAGAALCGALNALFSSGTRVTRAGKVHLLVRILFLSPFPSRPLYGGAVVRNHHLGRALTKRHQVFASFCGLDGDPQWAGEVPLAGPGWRALFDPLFLQRARRAIRANTIEAIVASSLIAGLHGALLKRLTGLPFWMDEHNVEWHCGRRYGHRAWWLVYLLEAFILRQADYVTCVSPDDRQRLITSFHLDPARVTVAPNGVDLPALHRAPPATPVADHGQRTVLFFGVLNYAPNREAVAALAEEIAPQAPPNVRFVVAGIGGEDLAQRYPQLHFEGFVPDIHALIRRCDGVIVPLKAGGGTRMKILESVACGRPVLSTACGAEGLDREALGPALTVTDQPAEMIRWLKNLPHQSLAPTGARFEETYDWETIWARHAPL